MATSVLRRRKITTWYQEPAAAKTFDEYAQQIFIPYISSQLQSVARVDLVWDTYKDDSLKGTTRTKRGKGVRRRLVGRVPYQETGRTFCGLTATRQNYSISCRSFSIRRSVRKTRKLSSPMGRNRSAHSYCRMSTSWPHAAMKKLIVVCYCTYHMLQRMAITRCSFALTDWGGGVKAEGIYEPHWTTLPQASNSCHELITCSCKSGCRKRCRWKMAALQCTCLCLCEGEGAS